MCGHTMANNLQSSPVLARVLHDEILSSFRTSRRLVLVVRPIVSVRLELPCLNSRIVIRPPVCRLFDDATAVAKILEENATTQRMHQRRPQSSISGTFPPDFFQQDGSVLPPCELRGDFSQRQVD